MLMTCWLLWAALPLAAQLGTKNGEWPSYGGDVTSHRYSPLDQINANNFSKLQVAWRFKTDNLGPKPEANLEGTPLMVKGVLYATAGTRRTVVALDPATGELLWKYSENEGTRGTAAPRQLSGRGLAYWSDAREERIIYVTPGYRMVALNAKTGTRVASFGKDGVVDLKEDDDQPIDSLNNPSAIAGSRGRDARSRRRPRVLKPRVYTPKRVFDCRGVCRPFRAFGVHAHGELGRDISSDSIGIACQ